MATRPRARYTEQERADYLAKFERSGLSQSEFCREAKLYVSTFSLWRRAATAGMAAQRPGFAEVRLKTSAPAGMVTLHLPSGAKLEVQTTTEAAWHGLGVLLKSLHS